MALRQAAVTGAVDASQSLSRQPSRTRGAERVSCHPMRQNMSIPAAGNNVRDGPDESLRAAAALSELAVGQHFAEPHSTLQSS